MPGRHPYDTEYDQEAREHRATDAAEAAHERHDRERVEMPPCTAGEALVAALIAYHRECEEQGRPPCDLAAAIRAIGAEGKSAREWLEARERAP